MKWKVVLDRLKKIRPTRLVILLFFVISNTFAWFIYATKIDNDVSEDGLTTVQSPAAKTGANFHAN